MKGLEKYFFLTYPEFCSQEGKKQPCKQGIVELTGFCVSDKSCRGNQLFLVSPKNFLISPNVRYLCIRLMPNLSWIVSVISSL